MSEEKVQLLQSLAQRLRTNPAFMAHALALYQLQRHLDEEELALELGAMPEMVVRLALCQKPQKTNADFAEEISRLSDFTLIEEAKLQELIQLSEQAVATSRWQTLRFHLAHAVMGKHLARLLTGIAEHLRHNPDFMAETLGLYQQQEGLTDERLAQRLGISQALLLQLALCKRPNPTAKNFSVQLQQLADYTGIEPHKLSSIIRQVNSNKELSRGKTAWVRFSASVLQAAIFRLRIVSFQQSALLACGCFIALVYLGVFWWQSATNHLQENPGIALLPEKANEPTDTTSAAPQGSKPLMGAAGGQLDRPSTLKSRTRPAKRVEREVSLLATVSVDLDEYKTMRNRQQSSEARKMIRLPQSRTRIVFNLPEGLVKGVYSILIIDAFNKPLVSSKARSTDGKTLTVVLDTTGLEAKSYRLCITHEGEAPNYYLVVIEKR